MTSNLKCSTHTRCRRSCLEPIEPSKDLPSIFSNWAQFNSQASPALLSRPLVKPAPGNRSQVNRKQYSIIATKMLPVCIKTMPLITETRPTRKMLNSCLRTTIITHLCSSTIGYLSSNAKPMKFKNCLSSTTSE